MVTVWNFGALCFCHDVTMTSHGQIQRLSFFEFLMRDLNLLDIKYRIVYIVPLIDVK